MILVAGGGRAFDDEALTFGALDALRARLQAHGGQDITLVRHGACGCDRLWDPSVCTGADRLIDAWASARGLRCVRHPATWSVAAAARYGGWVCTRCPNKKQPVKWDWVRTSCGRCGTVGQVRGLVSYDPGAGVERNQRMLEPSRPDLGLVFPGGPNTRDLTARLLAARVPTWGVAGREIVRL